MGVRSLWGVAVLAGVLGEATAGTVDLENGLPFGMTGRVRVPVDDFGAYGLGISPQNDDAYQPAGENFIGVTWLAGAFVFVRTPDTKESAVLLNGDLKWHKFVEPDENNAANGLAGTHTNLVRNVVDGIVKTGATAHSTFNVSAAEFALAFDLTQSIAFDAMAGRTELRQAYAITNPGAGSLDVTFHVEWDGQLIWSDGFEFNIVGVGQGLCYTFMTDMQGGDRSIAMTDGGSSVPVTSYYGGKAELTPEEGPPVYTAGLADIFVARGTPASWQNHIANVQGPMVAGSSGSTPGKDAVMGLEWKFALAGGATETIVVRRIYGTSALVCPGGANCGDTNLDGGEQCDEGPVDTPACNAFSCTSTVCGDGYVNMAAEDCDPNGVGIDSGSCNSDCTIARCGDGKVNLVNEACDDGVETTECNADCTMATCGDGQINLARDEQCEAGELCDLATCRYDFELGGGCAGCTTQTPDASWILGVLTLGFAVRRRRYN